MQPPNKKSAGVKRKASTITFFENEKKNALRFREALHRDEQVLYCSSQRLVTDPDRATVQQWRVAAESGGVGPVVAPPAPPPTVTVAQGGVMTALMKGWHKTA